MAGRSLAYKSNARFSMILRPYQSRVVDRAIKALKEHRNTLVVGATGMMGFTCDPVGPENDDYIARAAEGAERIVCAWGAGCPWQYRPKAVLGMLLGAPLFCLGVTKDGHPRHPLYVRGDKELEPFSLAGRGEE